MQASVAPSIPAADEDEAHVIEFAYAYRHVSELGAAAQELSPQFDYHLCFAVSEPSDERPDLMHVRHRLNPHRFRSPSNDVSGVMGLLYELGEKEGDKRTASFERAVADMILFRAEEAVRAVLERHPDAPITLLIRGPLFPKLRGRLLMSGIADSLSVYLVTSEPKLLERMDLHANSAPVPLENLQRMEIGHGTEMIPPAGIDKGTRCWIIRNADGVSHFELIANMDRGIAAEDWCKIHRSDVERLADNSLTSLYAEAVSAILQFYGQVRTPILDEEGATTTRQVGTSGSGLADAKHFRPLQVSEAAAILSPYQDSLDTDWPDFRLFLENEFCPKVNALGRDDDARAALRDMLPRHGFEAARNRLRSSWSKDKLREILRQMEAAAPDFEDE